MAKQKGISGQWQEKICPKCGIELTEDNHVPGRPKRKNYICRDCAKKYRQKNKEKIKEYQQKYRVKNKRAAAIKRKARYQKNKEYFRKYQEKYRIENKERIEEVRRKRALKQRKLALNILGGNCVYCGCDIYEALEINHIYGGGKKRPPGNMLVRHILTGKADLSKLEVTCRICNAWHYLTKLKSVPDCWTISWKHMDAI